MKLVPVIYVNDVLKPNLLLVKCHVARFPLVFFLFIGTDILAHDVLEAS